MRDRDLSDETHSSERRDSDRTQEISGKIVLFSTIEKSVGKEIKMLNDINGYTRTCGLIGNPVEHTLSPVIHNTLSMVLGKIWPMSRSMWRPEDWRMP